MAGTTYQELLDGVASYYGSGSDQWAQIAQYGVTQQTLPIIEQVPGVTITTSNSGKYLGYDYSNPFATTPNPASGIDSNIQTGAYGEGAFNAQLPATAVTDPSTGTMTMQSGARTVSGGSTVATIADRTSLAVVGVALGTKLGKLIDGAIYSTNPEWWDEHYPSINPQTWDDIATTQGGKNFIRSLFGLENDDATMYLDERMLAYTYMMMLANGAYSSGGGGTVSYDDTIKSSLTYPNNYANPLPVGTGFKWVRYRPASPTQFPLNVNMVASDSSVVCICIKDSLDYIHPIWTCRNQFTITEYWVYNNGTTDTVVRTPNQGNVVGVGTVYYYSIQQYKYPPNPNANGDYFLEGIYSDLVGSERYIVDDILKIYYLGNYVVTPTLPGVTDNSEASEHIDPNTLINPTTGQPVTPNDDPTDVLQALQNQYPDLFNGSIYEDVPQSDGTTQRITYIPVPYPDTTNPTQPISDTTPGIDPQTNPQVNPDNRTPELVQQLTDTLTTDPTAPDTGGGSTPPAIIPTGSANALYSIYNPSQSELDSFGAWLWSSNFVDQLLKLFNDPMQAIIGLHKVFAPPVISGVSTIKVGYLDSGVSSNVVGNQYTTIDCGYVDVSEYFGNVFDYDPFTQIYIYLPFVGIEKLDTGDVMRGRVGVRYHIDVITGACLAEISVTRDSAGGILYTFAGNCAVQYPISSGSYMGIVASLASIAGGVVGTVASGGALAPVAMGGVSGVLNAHTRVQHSGAFSGNAGAMGVKIPYLIITRPQTCLADNFPAFDGYPANKMTTLSACSGFVKCETCHVENIPATDAELSEIEMLLKGGIII